MVSILRFQNRHLIVADEIMEQTVNLAARAAKASSPVLLSGESGTGKELIARYIHEKSDRARGPFISVNCAAIPEGLMEAELFGFERGAFTGAVHQRIGKFERANWGTLLLDEISEIPIHLQSKLLRVLQEGEIDRLGGKEPIPICTRIIATTNRDLSSLIQKEAFREDLYYRLNVLQLSCVSLRGRRATILALAREFLKQSSENQGRGQMTFSDSALEKLVCHDWPGNIRELQNAIERAVVLSEGAIIDTIGLEGIRRSGEESVSPNASLADVEKSHILCMLQRSRGNRTQAARTLGISVRTLRNKLKEYGA